MIRLIGDSHCLTFQGAKNVECHWLGAAPAYTLWKKHKLILDIVEKNPGDAFWFCFGEIDCRIHIYNSHMKYGTDWYVLLRNTVHNYVNFINDFSIDHTVKVMHVPPQGFQGNFFDYPYYATREDRQLYTYCFNDLLDDCGWKKEEDVIDIWGNAHSLWSEEYFQEDECHIKKEVAIEKLEVYLAKRN